MEVTPIHELITLCFLFDMCPAQGKVFPQHNISLMQTIIVMQNYLAARLCMCLLFVIIIRLQLREPAL